MESKNTSIDKLPTKHGRQNRYFRNKKWYVRLLDVALIFVVIVGTGYTYIYSITPEVIRSPKLEHYHFRMQIVVDGKAEDFSTEGYQTGYAKDQCNANLPEQPIHFHDNKDQFTHIHWEGMTGGMVLKYYGWNFIGGPNNSLGYKLNDITDIQKVTTHGEYLPAISEGSQFYVYIGNETGFKQKPFEEFRDQDLEEFLEKTSNFPAHDINNGSQTGLGKLLTPKATAQANEVDTVESEEEKLTRINNMLGNVVIFVQKDAPSNEQIKERFNDLEPLSDSTCGG